MKTEFIVTMPTDYPAKGLFSGMAKISIEDDYNYDHDMVMGVKEALSHLYAVPIECVHEEEGYATIRLNSTETLTG